MSHDARLLALALAAVSGCATEQAPPLSNAPSGARAAPVTSSVEAPIVTTATVAIATRQGPDAVAHLEENLARLQALQLFEASELVQYGPPEAYHCYGPCPGAAPLIEAGRTRAAERLDALTSIAERVAREPVAHANNAAACEPAAIERNLEALRALRAVTVGELVTVEARNDGRCYGPCADQTEAARAATCEKAQRVASIAAEVEALPR